MRKILAIAVVIISLAGLTFSQSALANLSTVCFGGNLYMVASELNDSGQWVQTITLIESNSLQCMVL